MQAFVITSMEAAWTGARKGSEESIAKNHVLMGILEEIVCTNVVLTVVEMDLVAASPEFAMKVARTDGVVYNVEHV